MRWLLLLAVPALFADDWPEWRGKGRLGVFNEEGLLERFPEAGLKVEWRMPVRSGFAGPAVANGRVFVMDRQPVQGTKGMERVSAFDAKTGKVLWTREWESSYIGLAGTYASGPRATPTVDGDRVYVLGAMGALHCLNVSTGEVLWSRDYVRDFKTRVPVWGMTAAPLIAGTRVICLVGGENGGKVIAFDKMTGKEAWRALDSDSETGYSPPILIMAGGRQQLVQWHSTGIASLDPETGAVFWQHPWRMNMGLNVGTPVLGKNRLFVSSFYNGPMMFDLDEAKPAARMAWKGSSDSEIKTDGLHALINTPVIDGDYIYGVCSYGQFRCLNAKTGERVWETMALTKEQARWSTAFLVRMKDRYIINNDRGDLILARLSPDGYQEISRTHLMKPTSNSGNRRELGFVNWSHPAYANGHIFARNDEEIICARLRK
ncbi:MAG TPA: PQQ-binding-like beta-propeller repeat protein [Bryobacteraceae bacterium]|nr:PQQ-binding-like beta-propeller repeat protein [Bryobacteraceae bacterium]